MKKFVAVNLVVLAAMLTASNLFAASHAQLSSTEPQIADKTPKVVTLNQNDLLKGIDNANGTMTVKEAGSYFVIAAAQVGGTGKGTIKLWMRQNGKDVDNSNTEQTIEGGSTAVLVSQSVVECKAGDKLAFVFSATTSNLSLVVSKPKGEPVVPSFIVSAMKVDAGAYAQLSSTNTQPSEAKGQVVTLNQTDSAKGIENKDGAITVKEAGVYFVIAAGQVGGTAAEGKGTVKLWMRQNGKDIDNSNTEQTVEGGSTSVVVCQGVAEFKAGDKLELMQSGKGTRIGMIASKPTGEPAIPSMVFSVFKVPGKAYAQISSLKTQEAAAEGKPIALESTDAAAGVENAAGTITVKEAGTYFAMAAGQVGGEGKGTVRLWVKQNGKDVDNSNTEQSVASGSTAVLVCQGVMELKAGDKIQLAQAATGTKVGMIASKPTGEPTIPSVILSLVKID